MKYNFSVQAVVQKLFAVTKVRDDFTKWCEEALAGVQTGIDSTFYSTAFCFSTYISVVIFVQKKHIRSNIFIFSIFQRLNTILYLCSSDLDRSAEGYRLSV